MANLESLIGIPYVMDAGPLNYAQLSNLAGTHDESNCQRLVQIMYWLHHHRFIESREMLLPFSLRSLGRLISEDPVENLASLQFGDLIFADRLHPPTSVVFPFLSPEHLIHCAFYLGLKQNSEVQTIFPSTLKGYPADAPLILHASYHLSQSGIETWGNFLANYKPIAARRIIN